MATVLVCVGKQCSNYPAFRAALIAATSHFPSVTLVHGGAHAAKYFPVRYAQELGLICKSFPADWGRYGPRAASVRDVAMIDATSPDLCVAFPGGAGIDHLLSCVSRRGIPIVRINPNSV